MAHTVLGLVAALLAAILFGSNFTIIKEYDVGDGIFWQLAMAVGVWLTGLVTVIIKCAVTGSPVYYFHPIALTSGIMWSVGNIMTSTIFKTIGMALGMSIWCATQLVVGWSTGKWGLLGTPKDDSVKIAWLNYLGVALVFISLILFFMVKPDNISSSKAKKDDLDAPFFDEVNRNVNFVNEDDNHGIYKDHDYHDLGGHKVDDSWTGRLSPCQRTAVGITCSVVAGICYGTMFSPVQWVIDQHKDDGEYSQSMLDYVFVVFNGIFISALFYFVLYIIKTRNKPYINVPSVFPSIIGGVVWAVAMTCYFIALDKNNLGVETTFPIVSSGPMIIGALWGVLYYKEIRGKRNLIFIWSAVLTAVIAVIAVSLSKFDL